MREAVSNRLLRSGAGLSVDRYEMARRGEADQHVPGVFTDEAQVLLLTGWVSRAQIWLAQKVRPRRRVADWTW